MPRGRLIAFNTLAAVLCVLFVLRVDFGREVTLLGGLLVAALVAVAELWVVRMAVFKSRWTMSMVEAVLAATLFHSPGTWLTIFGALGMAAAQVARQQNWVKAVTNVTMYGLCFATAGAVSAAFSGGSPFVAAAAGTLAFWTVNIILLSLIVGWVTGNGMAAVFTANAPVSAAHLVANLSLGLLAGWVYALTPWALLAFAAPALVIFASYRTLTSKVDEIRLLSEVVNGQQQVRGKSIEDTAQALMYTVFAAFQAQRVDMIVLDSDGPRRYELETGAGLTMVEVGPSAAEADWLTHLFGADRIATGRTSDTSWLALQIGSFPGPVIALRALAPGRRAEKVGAREARLARLLANQADAWLRDIPVSDTCPLPASAGAPEATVRDAAARLVTLVESSQDDLPVADILHSLHRVERAVAVRIGDAPGGAPMPADGDVDERWVNTGTLERAGVAR